eukprot:5704458-Amphidinium_carterae.2
MFDFGGTKAGFVKSRRAWPCLCNTLGLARTCSFPWTSSLSPPHQLAGPAQPSSSWQFMGATRAMRSQLVW